MAISVWCGESKPKNLNDFLRPFVTELHNLLLDGLRINQKQISIKIRAFICDTPARSFIKGIVGHNNRFGCQKCMCEGTYYNSAHTMSFHRIITTDRERENELRTDKRFRERYQPQHHLADSILEILPIDMVQQFSTSDDLHLLHLGLMKR